MAEKQQSQDISLVEKDGYVDMEFDENGDIKMDDSYDSLIISVLGTNASDQLQNNSDLLSKEGSVLDTYLNNQDLKIKNNLWLINWVKFDLSASIAEAKRVLKFLIENDYVDDIIVTGEVNGTIMNLYINYIIKGNKYSTKFKIWRESQWL